MFQGWLKSHKAICTGFDSDQLGLTCLRHVLQVYSPAIHRITCFTHHTQDLPVAHDPTKIRKWSFVGASSKMLGM